ncbi:MAG: hypothetical protein AAF723_04215, partial [Pseudomonadota bacterium]
DNRSHPVSSTGQALSAMRSKYEKSCRIISLHSSGEGSALWEIWAGAGEAEGGLGTILRRDYG